MSPRTQPGLSHAMLEGVSRAWGIRGGGWGRAGSDPVAREPSYRGERRDELREGGRGGRQHVICFMATAHPVWSSGYKTPPAVAKRFPHSFWTGVGSHLGSNCHERCCTPVAKSSHIIVAHAGQKRQSFAEGGGRVAIIRRCASFGTERDGGGPALLVLARLGWRRICGRIRSASQMMLYPPLETGGARGSLRGPAV